MEFFNTGVGNSNSKFIVNDVFELRTRNLIVFIGNMIEGEISSDMFLLCEKRELHIKINSVENVNSQNANIGLTFKAENELDRSKLMGISHGNVLVFIIDPSKRKAGLGSEF